MVAALSALAFVAAVRWAIPLRTLAPTGAAGVAIKTWTWSRVVDGSPRDLEVRVYYPSEQPFSPRLHSRADLPDTTDSIVVLIHGALGTHRSHLSLAYELVSRGHVVLAADHPDAALWWGGSNPHWSSAAHRRVLTQHIAPAVEDDAVRDTVHSLTADAQFLSERASTVLRAEGAPRAYVGHGIGGWAAVQACEQDPACRAAITLDGPPGASVTRPTLWIASDPTTSPPHQGVTKIVVPNAGSLDLSDAPLQVRGPLLRALLPSRLVGRDALSALSLTREVSAVFASRHLWNGAHDPEDAIAPWPSASIQEGGP
jgi:alpha-beta hydrolase superfamily lysophospholipase